MSVSLYEGMTNAEYHDSEELGRSDALTILRSGPKTLRHSKDFPSTYSSPAMEFGSMFHTGMESLEELDRIYGIDPDGDKRTKAYKEEKAELVAAYPDKKWVSLADYKAITAMVDSTKQHPRVRELGDNLLHEASLFGKVNGYKTVIKARPDALQLADDIIVDWKTTADASQYSFEKSVQSFGYFMQPAWYKALCEQFFDREFQFWFVCTEKSAPYNVAVYQLPEEWEEYGRIQMKKAIAMWDEAVETGIYKGYPEHVVTLNTPRYVKEAVNVI